MTPITTQESNFTAEVINVVGQILDLKPKIDELIGSWNANQFGSTIDEDGIEDAWVGLTKQELIDNITGLIAIQTAIGDFVSGHASNFVKLRNVSRVDI